MHFTNINKFSTILTHIQTFRSHINWFLVTLNMLISINPFIR